MNQKTKYITGIVLSVLAICALTIPAFALTESDVQSQVSASGKEGVAGNLFVWFLCAVAFLKISQKIDSFMQGLGINVGHTGGSIWHEIHNAYRTRRMLSGMLSGIERTEAGKTIAIVDYKGFRIVIPLKEMVLDFPADMYGADYNEMILRHQKILNKMLGAEVDLMVKGIDAKSRTVVASRKDAMLKKQQIYYFGKDGDGQYRIYDGRVVEARVIAVAEQVVRVEVFGVETSILARDLSWDWIGDAHDRYAVGDKTLVRVLEIDRTEPEHIRIKADIKSVSGNSKNDNLQKCRIQGKYAGKVTHIHKGVVYIRLSNGANAIAHSCYDRRRPGRKDDVSFAVTHLDEEHGVALGIITRIIKQHV